MIKKENNVQLEKTDNKYIIALKLINKILININKKEIDDLTKEENGNKK